MAPPPGSRRRRLRVPCPVFREAGEPRPADGPDEAAARTAGEEPIFLRATAAAASDRAAVGPPRPRRGGER